MEKVAVVIFVDSLLYITGDVCSPALANLATTSGSNLSTLSSKYYYFSDCVHHFSLRLFYPLKQLCRHSSHVGCRLVFLHCLLRVEVYPAQRVYFGHKVSVGRALFPLFQDVIPSARFIMQEWQVRKLSHAQAIEDLYLSRDRGLLAAVNLVTRVMEQEETAARKERVATRFKRLRASMFSFRSHAVIDEFLGQFRDVENSAGFRFKLLLLRGKTRSAKSQRAASLFGFERTLLVNMQGLGANLPCLRKLSKKNFDSVVFDEATHEQVLANKMLFQAGPWSVSLGQSACGQHAYELDVYGVPLILCSNDFKLYEHEGLTKEQSSWLRGNILEAVLPPNAEVWYHIGQGPS